MSAVRFDPLPPTAANTPIEELFPAPLKAWFAGSHVTVDGRPSDRPLMVFRGCADGDDDVGGVDVVTGKPLDVFWATSSRRNAAFFEDGEIQNLYIRLVKPFVVRGQPPWSPSKIARRLWESVQAGEGEWDGVIFEDVVDGSHPSVVYAVFPQGGTVRERVRIVGRTRFDADGSPVHSGIQPPGPDPDRFDEICHEHVPAYGLRRADIELHTLVPDEATERARERSGCMS